MFGSAVGAFFGAYGIIPAVQRLYQIRIMGEETSDTPETNTILTKLVFLLLDCKRMIKFSVPQFHFHFHFTSGAWEITTDTTGTCTVSYF